MDRAITRSPEFYRLVQLVFEKSQHPKQLYRTFECLLRLQKSAPADSFDKACLIAIEYRNFSYKFVERILKNRMEDHQHLPVQEQPLPPHHNIRGKEYYTQTTIKF